VVDQLLIAGVSFGRNCIGIVLHPYEAYRRIVREGSLYELIYITSLLIFYFALASVVKVAAFRPFLLTRQFIVLVSAVVATYCVVICLLWLVGQKMGGKGTLRGVAIAWGYTLVPTVLWFFVTSLLYVVLPPPRTTSLAGIALSALFLAFSATLFLWKLMLGYLALRFGLKLDLARILVVVAVVGPVVGIYSYGMYQLGIFKVPFV